MTQPDETTVVPEIITHPVPSRLLDSQQCPEPHVNSMEQYCAMWKESVEEPNKFFGNVGPSFLFVYK
jgi:acetyl-CoA synthetase